MFCNVFAEHCNHGKISFVEEDTYAVAKLKFSTNILPRYNFQSPRTPSLLDILPGNCNFVKINVS